MAITVASGFWNDIGGSGAGYVMQSGVTPVKGALKRLFRRSGLRDFDALTAALTGAVAGGTATATSSQVAAQTNSPVQIGDLVGNRTISTYTFVNRVTTGADETAIDNLLTARTRPAFPADLANNGATGKALA